MTKKRFMSVNEFCRANGVPVGMVRREVRQKMVPGFFSGSWFYIDEPQYLAILSERNLIGGAVNEAE